MADMKFVVDYSDVQTMRRELVGVSKDAKKSASVFETAYNKAERQLQKTAKANQQFYNDTLKVDKATKSASQSADVFTRELQKQEKATQAYNKELNRLKGKYVENYGASQRYKKEIRDLLRAKRQGIVTTDQYGDAVQRLKSDFRDLQNGVVKGSNQLASYNVATYRANQNTKRFASVGLQQAGYQVGDFAVQMQGGTNAAVAFGQQGSQLLGIFGAGGAIAGAALAITTAFVAPLLDAKKKAEEFESALESMSSAISSAKNALDIHQMSVIELTDKYGRLGFAVKEASVDIARLDFLTAVSDLKKQTVPAIESLENALLLLDTATRTADSSLKEIAQRDYIEPLQESLGLTTEQMRDLNSAYQDFQNAGNLKDKIDAALSLKREMSNIPEEILATDGSLNKALKSINELITQSGELERATGRVEDSAPGSDWMDSAIQGVNSLYNRIVAAIAGVKDLKNESSNRPDRFKTRPKASPPLVDDPAYAGSRPPGIRPVARNEVDLTKGALGGSSGGGGGSGGTQQQTAMQKLVKQIELNERLLGLSEARQQVLKSLGDEASNYNQKQIDAVVQRIQAYDMEKQALEEARQQMQTMADTLENSMSKAFMSMVEGTVSFKDAMRDMARAVIKQLFDILVVQKLVGSFNSSTGKGSGIVGAIMGLFADGAAFNKGKVTAFADGGVVSKPTMFPMANGMGLMGEAGPEAVMPLKRGKGGKLGVMAEGGSSGGNVTIHQNFNFSANGDESVKKIIQQEAPKISAMTEKQIINSRRRGGSLKQAFG